ncbi:MAG: molybdopterin converting factor subunit 1 [Acidobacteria bacterium]|nr:molybdopterin converting factor subunit 1 [Acidobacteriota bacterium]
MRVTVRLFARLRELAGRGDLDCECPGDAATVADVWQQLVARYPALAPYERAVSCAVNAEYARRTSPVADGDEVAFLPPVSGG